MELSDHLAALTAGACLNRALAGLPLAIKQFSAHLLIIGNPEDIRRRTEALINNLGEMRELPSTTGTEKTELGQAQDFLRVYLAITVARGGWTTSDQQTLAE